ncbi:MAG: FtsH protease activity modulator HflK [Nevskiales bacterium]|nr:FtsH protease activity modulator HflK [Nevskiales bacterium]
MAWNEPGGNRDPWSPGGRRSGGNPPDWDEMLQRLKARFKGKGPGQGGWSAGSASLVFAALVLLWFVLCFYTVDAQERAVVLRFGEYVRANNPGWGWRAWPIEEVIKVNVTQVRQVTERSDMLTQDENIVDVELKVQYRVNSVEKYLFSQADPDTTLRQVTKSAVREVVGGNKMDFILTEGRQEVASRTKLILQERLDAYSAGLVVAEVNLQNVQAPEPVQGAFADAIKAREDQERLKNEAEAYANDRLPRARGAAARELAEATAYRDRRVAEAEGESARFLKLLTEYRKSPRVTRDRLYLETMQDVMKSATKIILDVNKNGPLIYLPLDQLNRAGLSPQTSPGSAVPAEAGRAPDTSLSGGELRSRDRGNR